MNHHNHSLSGDQALKAHSRIHPPRSAHSHPGACFSLSPHVQKGPSEAQRGKQTIPEFTARGCPGHPKSPGWGLGELLTS